MAPPEVLNDPPTTHDPLSSTAPPPRSTPSVPGQSSSTSSGPDRDFFRDTVPSFSRGCLPPSPKLVAAPGFDLPRVTIGVGCGRGTSKASPHLQLTSTPLRKNGNGSPLAAIDEEAAEPATSVATSETTIARIPLQSVEEPLRGAGADLISVVQRPSYRAPRASPHVPSVTEPADISTPPGSPALATPPPSCTREVLPASTASSPPPPGRNRTEQPAPFPLLRRAAPPTVSREHMFSRAPEPRVSENILSGTSKTTTGDPFSSASPPPSTLPPPPYLPPPPFSQTFDGTRTFCTDHVVLFWQPPSPFSQWTAADFSVRDANYVCAEQFFMAEKARLFHDDSSLHLIMETKDPREHKRLGRQVRGFDRVTWDRERVNVAFAGNYAKFSQNPDMCRCLLSTGDRLLAEASPFDSVWGIGLRADDPDASCPSRWPGEKTCSARRARRRAASSRRRRRRFGPPAFTTPFTA